MRMQNTSSKWDAIVIGSGIGGLTCAAALAKHGWKILVLEQHYVAGGCTHMFSRKGYHWDVGVHCVGQMHIAEVPRKTIDWLSNGKIQFNPLGRAYDSFHFPDGFKMELPDTKEKFRAVLKENFPKDGSAIDQYFELIDRGADAAKYCFASRTLPLWLDKLTAPLIDRLGQKWWLKTTDEVLRSIVSNSKLFSVLTAQWGYYGSTPKKSSFLVHAMTVRHFWNGGYYPSGGAKVFADHFVETIRAGGGDVLTRKSVKEIIIRDGNAVGVRLENGEELFAPKIISGAGAKATVDRLLPEAEQKGEWVREIRELPQSPAYLTLYLGFEGDVAAAGGTLANQWHFEDWDMEKGEWDISDPKSESPFLYISFPSLKDPRHVAGPEKKHTGEVVVFVPWDAFEKWKHTRRGYREKDYMEFKKGLEQRLFAQFKKHHPKLAELVKFYELSTPLSTAYFIRAPQGAIYGLAPTPQRFGAHGLSARTPVKNLYMTGCDVAVLGIAGALTGGIITAGVLETQVLKRLF